MLIHIDLGLFYYSPSLAHFFLKALLIVCNKVFDFEQSPTDVEQMEKNFMSTCLLRWTSKIYTQTGFIFDSLQSFELSLMILKAFSALWSIKAECNNKLYGPFLWMRFDCLKATEPLWGSNSLFTRKFPEILGTHLIELKRMKGWVDLEATQWFWT